MLWHQAAASPSGGGRRLGTLDGRLLLDDRALIAADGTPDVLAPASESEDSGRAGLPILASLA